MKSIVAQPLGSDLMLYDGEKDAVHVLNPASRLIYQLHLSGQGVEAMVEALRGSFEVPPGQDLEADVRQALQDLAARGLV